MRECDPITVLSLDRIELENASLRFQGYIDDNLLKPVLLQGSVYASTEFTTKVLGEKFNGVTLEVGESSEREFIDSLKHIIVFLRKKLPDIRIGIII